MVPLVLSLAVVGVFFASTSSYVDSDVIDVIPYAQDFLQLSSSWMSSPSPSVSNVASCVTNSSDWNIGSSYYWYVYYYYTEYESESNAMCGCNGFDLVLPGRSRPMQLWLVLLWMTAFMVLLSMLNTPCSLLAGLCASRGMWCLHAVVRLVGGIRADCGDAEKAFRFLVTELIFILARRLPVGKHTLRRIALRWRPYTVANLTTGEPVFVHSPAARASGTPMRRSLAQIQLDFSLHQGGCRIHRRKTLNTAKFMATTRLTCPRSRTWRTSYNPSSSSSRGDCLFMVLSKLVPGRWTAKTMRKAVRQHAADLLVSGDKVLAGYSLSDLLSKHSVDTTWFMKYLSSSRPRWGNTIDVLIAAHLFGINLCVYDIERRRTICGASLDPSAVYIGYYRHHFVSGTVRPRKARTLQHGGSFCRWLGSCVLIAALGLFTFRSGGALRAGTDPTQPPLARQFALQAHGEDDRTLHTIRNMHDLAVIDARYVEEDEVVFEPEEVDEFGYGIGSYTRELEGDDRPLIRLLLRRIRRSLHTGARIGERIWNFPSATPTAISRGSSRGDSEVSFAQLAGAPAHPQHEDEFDSDGIQIAMEHDVTAFPDTDFDPDYDVHSYGTSRGAEFSPGDTSPGSWRPMSLASSMRSRCTGETASCLDSNRTNRMGSHCSSRSDLDIDEFVQFTPAEENLAFSWSNPLQLIPLAHEFYMDHVVQEPGSCLFFEPPSPPQELLDDTRSSIDASIASLQRRLAAITVPRAQEPYSPVDLDPHVLLDDDYVPHAPSASSTCFPENRFVLIMQDGSLVAGGAKQCATVLDQSTNSFPLVIGTHVFFGEHSGFVHIVPTDSRKS
eukprot:6357947-Amphidinium_carterae.1